MSIEGNPSLCPCVSFQLSDVIILFDFVGETLAFKNDGHSGPLFFDESYDTFDTMFGEMSEDDFHLMMGINDWTYLLPSL